MAQTVETSFLSPPPFFFSRIICKIEYRSMKFEQMNFILFLLSMHSQNSINEAKGWKILSVIELLEGYLYYSNSNASYIPFT